MRSPMGLVKIRWYWIYFIARHFLNKEINKNCLNSTMIKSTV